MYFVSSWDDGHPSDRRLASLYEERGMLTTFFVPRRNSEGRPVVTAGDLRAIDASGFEIGSHTADHVYLHAVSPLEAKEQIRAGKQYLEDVVGHPVAGFCYPGGRRPRSAAEILIELNVRYARTVENLRSDLTFGKFDVPTTLQFYPHHWAVLSRNAARQPSQLMRKLNQIFTVARTDSTADAVLRSLDALSETRPVFHLWGHSWEIDALGLWADLERVLDGVLARGIRVLTVSQLCELRAGWPITAHASARPGTASRAE